MKRIVEVLLSMIIIFAASPFVWAAEGGELIIADNNINTACVTLELILDSSMIGKTATLRVYAEGDSETIANMLWADEGIIGADGKCIFTIDMNNYDTNKYVFVSAVSGSDKIYRTEPMQIYGAQEKNDLLTRLTNAKANTDISEFEWVVENRWEYLSLIKEGYDAIVNTENVNYHDIFCLNVLNAEFATLDEFMDKFNKTVCIAKLYTTSDARGVVDIILEKFELTQNNAYKDYTNMLDPTIGDIVSSKLAGDCLNITADNFEQKFNTAVVFKLLEDNINTWSSYEAVLVKYAAEIGIDMTEYNNLSNQSVVINGMISNNSAYADFDDVASDFGKLVETQKNAENKKPTSIGGIMGSGSSRPISSGGFTESMTSSGTSSNSSNEQAPEAEFNDMTSCPWALEAVNYLSDRGIVSGKGDGKFDPEGNITRAEAVKMLVTAFGIPASNDKINFTDVKSDQWYYEYICAAYNSGMICGISADEFAPNENITRQDIAVLLNRAIKCVNTSAQLVFEDRADIADYAAQAVANLVYMGIIAGMEDNRFEPQGYTTRAQAAKMFFEIIRTGV